MDKQEQNQQGFILATVLVITAAMTVIGLALIAAASSQYKLASDSVFAQNAMLAAEAGIEQSVNALNQDNNFTGYPTAQEFYNNSVQGVGRFTTSIVDNPSDDNAKILTSTGYAYRQSDTTNEISKRTLKVTVVGTSDPDYAVNTGPGGLILGGSANITNSQVYVGGTITMSGNSRIGSDAVPATVNVANKACPTGSNPGPTYPIVCPVPGTQPISIPNWSTVAIIGTTCATGQTQAKFPDTANNNNLPQIRASSTNGGEGLKPNCTAPAVAYPTYDRAAHIAAVAATGAGNSNTYACNSSPFNRSWPANLKLTGNVTIGSSCDVTINGDVYITGNLTLNGAAKIRVPNSLGTNRPTVIVDGTISVGGSASLIANSAGTGIEFISFKSSASCNPNCTTVTGTDLKTSQSQQTVSIGGGVSLPGMVFNAYWGKITISGSGNIGSAIGQTVDLNGAGTVVFGTNLSSGNKTWTITSYQQVFQ